MGSGRRPEVMAGELMRVGAIASVRIGVKVRVGEAVDVMEQTVTDLLQDPVGSLHRQLSRHRDIGVSVELVTAPADPDVAHRFNAGRGGEDGLDGVGKGRVDAVHEPPVNLKGGVTSTLRMARPMSSPITGSASRQPSPEPRAAPTTARDVSPSVRAWRPS